MKYTHNFYFDLQCIIILISFLVSLKLIKNENAPKYMEGFYLYPTVGLLCAIPSYLESHYFPIKYSQYLLNFSLIFHFYFLGNFIFKILPRQNLFFKTCFYLQLIIIFIFLFYADWKFLANKAFAITNLSLALLSFLYFFQVLRENQIGYLLKEPSFWVVSGIFIGMGLESPLSAVIDYLTDNTLILQHKYFFRLIVMSYIIMHLFFIKAYLCSIRVNRI